MWAEKEMRNYRRLALSGVPCPPVHMLRDHVLLMGFLGHDGYAAPRLKDAPLSHAQYVSACEQVRFPTPIPALLVPLSHAQYVSACEQTLLALRKMYQQCRLVHGDFSEYNLLWYKGVVYVIDVSQSVEHDHPNALLFLRKDCENAISFFHKHGVRPLPGLQALFDFVVDRRVQSADDADLAAFHNLMAAAAASPAASASCGGGDGVLGVSAEAQVAEAVFAQMHIPRTLEEVSTKQMELCGPHASPL